jgi:hypothetical protein
MRLYRHNYTTSHIVHHRYTHLSPIFSLLEWIPHLIILPQPYLLLLLSQHMLHPHLLRLILHEPPNKARIPQLARHAQILTAAHQRIRFAPLSSSRNTLRGEIVLLAPRDRHKPTAIP